MKRQSFFKAVLAAITLSGISFSAEIYVSPTGSDAADGSFASPLATLAKARDKADQLKAGGPVTVFLRGGTYCLTEPVVFGPSNSGTAAAPIVYTAYGTEKPVLSGAIKLTNQTWTVSSGSIMKTTIASNLKVDQLFLNGKRQVMARYPNFNENQFLQGSAADALNKAGGAAKPEEVPGYIRALHTDLWGGNSFIITGKGGGTVSYTWVGDNQRGNGMHAQYRMVENIYELLDAAGEWLYRRSTGELFFWPPSGTDLNSAVVEMASQDELIRVVGTSMTAKASHLTFRGLTFAHTSRTMFNTAIKYEPLFMGDWCIQRTGTLFMQNAEHIRVECCTFDQVGGNALFMSGYNRKHVIFNNTFEGGGSSCVVMCGLSSSVRCPCMWSSSLTCNDNTPGPASEEYPAYIPSWTTIRCMISACSRSRWPASNCARPYAIPYAIIPFIIVRAPALTPTTAPGAGISSNTTRCTMWCGKPATTDRSTPGAGTVTGAVVRTSGILCPPWRSHDLTH